MKTIDKKSIAVRAAAAILLLFSCFYMYDFYKCLSGFIANGFREPLVMLPMILAFFLPVFCFFFFFYDFFVKAINPIVKTAYSVFVSLYAAADLALIFNNIELYASNNSFGVYDSLPSIVLHFPYDMIIVLSAILLLQIFNLAAANRPTTHAGALLNGIKQRGALKVHTAEYIPLCVLAIVVFVFTGSAIYATFSALKNALYDARYIYLLVWVMLIPMANLAILTLRPEKMKLKRSTKMAILGSMIAINLIFAALFAIFELTQPDFLVHISKPLFLIAFSVSLPIEPVAILGIMALGTAIVAIRLLLLAANRYERN